MNIPPFSEGKNILDFRSKTHVSNSMDTSAMDPYRQGLELTQNKYFQLGFGKIWSGEQNGELYQSAPNEIYVPVVDIPGYEDFDKFSPTNFVNNAYANSSFIIDGAVRVDSNEFNGIIEPLTIRSVITFTSIDAPVFSHIVRGTLESGNENRAVGDDQTKTSFPVVDTTSKFLYYEDNVDMMNNLPTNLGFFPRSHSLLPAYDDSQIKDGVLIPSGALV